jgi:hypothetical protein
MRTPKINTKKLVAALAPVALAGAMIAPTAAASTSPSTDAPAVAVSTTREPPTQLPVGTPIALLMIGAALMFLPEHPQAVESIIEKSEPVRSTIRANPGLWPSLETLLADYDAVHKRVTPIVPPATP